MQAFAPANPPPQCVWILLIIFDENTLELSLVYCILFEFDCSASHTDHGRDFGHSKTLPDQLGRHQSGAAYNDKLHGENDDYNRYLGTNGG